MIMKSLNLKQLEGVLLEHIKGQNHVIPRVAKVIKRGELNLTNSSRPKGNFLFLGPTGTGKTELTKVFTQIIFADEVKLIRFDMSEYQTKEAIETLIGDKSGWNGRLGEALIKSKGSGTLLFDEIEKAHPDMKDIFLQMMDDARLTTGVGLTHDLSAYYIVLTSNVGADKLMNSRRLNFSTIEKSVKASLAHQGFRDEFTARFNEVILFKMLDYDTMREIAILNIDRELKRLNRVLSQKFGKKITLVEKPEVIDLVVMEGTNARLGARPIRNYVETSIQNAVAEKILLGEIPEGVITVCNSYLVIR
ncbi:MAG: AAA family ATPase [Lentisphaeraceae bacterium]|nr:AAA family ATPase [Lentisphaeraceae bacterium]